MSEKDTFQTQGISWRRRRKYRKWKKRHCDRDNLHCIDTAHYFMTGEQLCWACGARHVGPLS